MKKILLIGPYPPLYSHGGPTRSIYGLHKLFNNTGFICNVISPNKNLNGSKIITHCEDSKVLFTNNFYSNFTCNTKKFDVVWFNSFFDFKLIYIIGLKFLFNFKLVVSPRGQLSKKAISTSNSFLKLIFIKIIGLFSNSISFHSTSDHENNDINFFFKTYEVSLIPNLFSVNYNNNKSIKKNFLFYSRIHPKKGLLFLLETLLDNNISINLDIYGFIEDKHYWNKCQKIISKLKNVRYKGEIKNGDISILRDQYTFYIFPTLNENYGHVIIELLSLGIIPIISKSTTPFDSLINEKIGLNFSLNSPLELSDVLNKTNQIDKDTLNVLKNSVYEIFTTLNKDQEAIKNDYINFIKQLRK